MPRKNIENSQENNEQSKEQQEVLSPPEEIKLKSDIEMREMKEKDEQMVAQEVPKLKQKVEEVFSESEKKRFGTLDTVWVKRTSGKMENWQVTGYENDNVIVAQKDEEGRTLKKVVPEEELIKWQEGGKIMEQIRALDKRLNSQLQDIELNRGEYQLRLRNEIDPKKVKELNVKINNLDTLKEKYMREYQEKSLSIANSEEYKNFYGKP